MCLFTKVLRVLLVLLDEDIENLFSMGSYYSDGVTSRYSDEASRYSDEARLVTVSRAKPANLAGRRISSRLRRFLLLLR